MHNADLPQSLNVSFPHDAPEDLHDEFAAGSADAFFCVLGAVPDVEFF